METHTDSQSPLEQGPRDIPKDRGRQAGQRGLHSEMALKGWQLPNSVWGAPCRRDLGNPTGDSAPLWVSRVSLNGRSGEQASLSPARVMTTLTSTSSHASSWGWHPRAAARHLLPERKAPSSQPWWRDGPARIPERRAGRSMFPLPGCGLAGRRYVLSPAPLRARPL